MKIAMIAGGQPRFTSEFLELLTQLQGFDSADLYLTFWTTDWVNSVEEGVSKIKSILPPKYNLVRLNIVDQPERNLPPHQKEHPPAEPENVRWAYKRRTGMWISTKMSFDMIEGQYDAYIKFRPDGMLSGPLDLGKLDLVNNELIYPAWPRNGKPGEEICDQFVVGTESGMRFYCDMINHFDKYIPVVSSNWEDDIHTWASEHLLAQHLKENNKPQSLGDFGHILAGIPGSVTPGRSRFTDKHYHHPIIPGPI
jgi:hypothetical protein